MLKSNLTIVFIACLFFSISSFADKKIMSVSEALRMAEAGELVLVDIRSEGEWFQTGVAPVAETISMHQQGGPEAFSRTVLQLLDGDKSAPIALICASGVRSAHMQSYLQSQGFTQVVDVSEGMLGTWSKPGWIAQNLPVIKYKKQ